MKTIKTDIAVIGGGPAGLAAALAAKKAGAQQVMILERNVELGGILQQCIHHGFGLHRYREELTGPEYAQRYINDVHSTDIEIHLETMVLEITQDRVVYAMNAKEGMMRIEAGAVILGMGCRERTRGALRIPGQRPAGVLTAGAAQRFVNIDGYVPGKEAVILGSGDIGLIMARRFTLEGAKVNAVVEIMPYAAGLTRNVVQCLDDFGIPLHLRSTVVNIHGTDRLEGVTIAQVDDAWAPITGTEQYIPCDTLLLSVGLIPENELSVQAGITLDPITSGPKVDHRLMTSVEGVFACGNVLHVHDVVDYVSQEAELAGTAAAQWLSNTDSSIEADVQVRAGEGVRYVVPHALSREGDARLFLRVRQPQDNVVLDVGGLFQLKQRSVRPSEMIQVKVSKKILDKLEGNTLTISIQEEVKAVG